MRKAWCSGETAGAAGRFRFALRGTVAERLERLNGVWGAGVEGLTQRLMSLKAYVKQQVEHLGAKQARVLTHSLTKSINNITVNDSKQARVLIHICLPVPGCVRVGACPTPSASASAPLVINRAEKRADRGRMKPAHLLRVCAPIGSRVRVGAQDETILAQCELKEAVGRVGSDVDNTLARVSEASARACRGRLIACQLPGTCRISLAA